MKCTTALNGSCASVTLAVAAAVAVWMSLQHEIHIHLYSSVMGGQFVWVSCQLQVQKNQRHFFRQWALFSLRSRESCQIDTRTQSDNPSQYSTDISAIHGTLASAFFGNFNPFLHSVFTFYLWLTQRRRWLTILAARLPVVRVSRFPTCCRCLCLSCPPNVLRCSFWHRVRKRPLLLCTSTKLILQSLSHNIQGRNSNIWLPL